jgi:anti-sigma-K factor RskA
MSEHQMKELAAAYALGSLPGPEREAFEAHLVGCEECRAELRSFGEVAGLLALAAPAAVPPDSLRERVLAEARRVRPIASPRRGPTWSWLAAAAAVVIAVAAALQAYRAGERSSDLESRLAATHQALAVSESTLAALLAPDVDVVTLSATGRNPSARVFWNQRRRLFVVTAFDLPAARRGRTYQLWAIAEGKAPVSMGTFNTTEAGRATLVIPVDSGITALGAVKLCAITEEPAGGSPQPTETPRLVGSWSRTR